MTSIKRLSILALFITFNLFSQNQKKEKSWDVSNPEGDWNFKDLKLSTNEGTWMNIDVSPDGKSIVFDLLGDIYIISSNGGNATILREGLAFEVQPRFSPDGKHISFTSDAGGGDNIWVMDTDGSNAKQITKENFRLLNNAIWTPDSNFLIARKHFTSSRSLGAGELWMYHKTGGNGIQLTKRKNDQQDVNEPSISSDGKYLYYSEDVYPGGNFQYNKDPNNQIYVINRYNMESGKIDRVTGGPGGAARPQISRDGKKLAFVKRVRTKSVLYIHDLETGEEWPVYDQLNKDQQEAWAIFGVYTNFNWMPNNEDIVFWSGGKINALNINTLKVKDIPFQVDATIKIAKVVKFDTPVAPDSFDAKAIRHVVTSPDETSIVFNAVGYLWIQKLPNGTPKRLTTGTDFEFEPAFSPDGKTISFVTWNDTELGAVKSVSSSGGTLTKLTSEKGIYRNPSYSHDGKKIVYRKEGGNNEQGRTFTKKTGLYIMNADGSNTKFITQQGDYPIFNATNDRIIYQNGGQFFGALTKELKSVELNGFNERTLIKSKHGNILVPSPDGKWIAFVHLHKVYMAPMPKAGKTLDLTDKTKFIPITQLSKDAGINLHWSRDSKTIHWTLGNEYFSAKASENTKLIETSIKINLNVKTDKPEGRIAFTNARIITMEGNEVIENGTIIINENKIEAIGNASDVSIPSNAKVYNVSGKTIMPGIVDAHAHIGGFRYGLTTQKHWQFYANLAFGVTTSHDPSAHSETVFALSELQKNGTLVGPRLYSTGFILYGADGDFKAVINNLDDARSSIRRTKAFGALSVKSYNQPRREQRQQVLQAAREESIFVVPEGGSTFYTNISMVMDGHTGVEHNIPVAPVYKDVIELWGNSNVGYTPTLIVNYGGVNGEYYWYQHTNVWENEKLLKYTPRAIIDSRSRYRTMVPEEEYKNGHILVSETAKTLTDAGVKVNLGAHGQLQGLGAHWELWLLQQGGMTNHEALKAATINGANYIGAGNDIGSLKKGKLADLIILDKNPLENIRNSESIIYTMINGRLYDTETMNEIGNNPKERTKFYWENSKYNQAFPWHEASQSFTRQACGCNVGTH
ncbi:amidohydrolase family protein [Winogradskyella immobilis]|uniref:PD40 domain-containing protein n=1 Tax=Winogradskyella immobilis TaxID=2816852 RepID=A0ABS8EPC3_9FLAO|nr:amidohydrolase family protein [Winogradskyella immobilis]MCC1485008.1 PD40 domain-containing protein [Winogradskyella immobilis]MCG0017100.1 amidohydrolase family protein [Winogradskyella immobilis]